MVPVVFLIKSKGFPWFPVFLALSRQAYGRVIRFFMTFCRYGSPMFCPCFPAFFRQVLQPFGGSRVPVEEGSASGLSGSQDVAVMHGTGSIPFGAKTPPVRAAPFHRCRCPAQIRKNRPQAAFPALSGGVRCPSPSSGVSSPSAGGWAPLKR